MIIELTKIKIHHKLNELSQIRLAEMYESVRKFGVINPLAIDRDYNLVDGILRYEACKKLGIKEIQVIIVTPTDPIEYKKQLIKLIKQYPEMDFATKLGVTQEKLLKKLLQLDDKTAQSVINGEITLLQAIQQYITI